MKYAWVDAHRKEFELVEMCEALAVSASGYRAWKRGGTSERKRLMDAQMLALIRANASHAFQARLKEYGMVCSMSRKGNCWDNAPTESFFNSLKNERVHGTRYGTRAEAAADLFDYIEPFYNRKRIHSTLGYASPVKYLEDWISAQHEEKLAA